MQKIAQNNLVKSGFGIKPQRGFTLIEVLIALAIVALIMAVAIPYIKPRDAVQERKTVVARLNALTSMARHNALMTGKTHKILFDFEKRAVRLDIETNKKNDKNEPIFEPVKGLALPHLVAWPESLVIKNFYIEGYDEMERSSSRTRGSVWFFVVPDGLAQDVVINGIDTTDKKNGKPVQFGLVLNPFSARFEVHDTFQK
ncbi:MAG TPA: prepilin-type N-terminal cleavage/methylation domain-containing protein [Candidatus Limnocylindria bacterium]|nr:prepilin-type N-terminal cleavage/methylation domain-containing protein [Candidatus Limnocylindria bacterium]